MATEYDRITPGRCKASVFSLGGFHLHQCTRKTWKDGWCKQHHPKMEQKREEESHQRAIKKAARSPRVLLEKCKEKVKRLERKVRRLECE